MEQIIQIIYFVTAFLFIFGLKRMSSPLTARSGVIWAGVAMMLATFVTFFWPGLSNYALMVLAVVIGGSVAWILGKKVSMKDMPQMIAVYNGMGGGAAAAIACVELMQHKLGNVGLSSLAVAGGLIGSIAFTGSVIAFAKLQGLMKERPVTFPKQQQINLIVLISSVALGILLLATGWTFLIPLFFAAAFAFGLMMTLPIGGGDMPVVISLYNALTGLAVGFEGFAMGNAAMIVAAPVVGAAGTLLTLLMAKAMNRSLANVLFGAFGQEAAAVEGEIKGSLKPIEVDDAAIMMGASSTS